MSNTGRVGRVTSTVTDPLARKPVGFVLPNTYPQCLTLDLVDVRGPQISVTFKRAKSQGFSSHSPRLWLRKLEGVLSPHPGDSFSSAGRTALSGVCHFP